MTSETIILTLVGLWLLAGIGLLSGVGRLTRYDLYRATVDNDAAIPKSHILEHFRPFQNLVDEFFARTEPCARVLNALKAQEFPVKANTLAAGIDRAALWIMRLTGLITWNKAGVALTDVGREVHRRISKSRSPRTLKARRASVYDQLFVPVGANTDSGAHIRRVREAADRARSFLDRSPRAMAPLSRIGELRKPLGGATPSPQTLQSTTTQTTSMKKRTIIMTAADHRELSSAVAAAGKLSPRGRAEMSGLEAELERAEIVEANDIPTDLITMNSRAELLDLETGERMEFTLAYPIEANIDRGKISVLAPLGTAMLGYRVGDEFEWSVPYGTRRLKVTAVHFQPEAALALAA